MTHSAKLNKNYQFRYVYRHGKSFVNDMFCLTFCPSKQQTTKAGLTVSKKNGKATQRNRIKRLMRESVRALYPRIAPGYNFVVTANARYDFGKDLTLRRVTSALSDLLARAGLLSTQD